ncbi:MAG: hypothetical protein K5905_14240 [Roseibium sp.]|uniref:hypothetical protein n=1 Tax=Roseibium sp. TaxID=1936156 RepID=UPI002634B4AC|nr:hypothetical protein [Roseibium sp.]MCV0426624.1 hypothetical protein [Roseibium sp.]
MHLTAARQFISAVTTAGRDVLGDTHPLLKKIEIAERSLDTDGLRGIQEDIDALPEQTRDDLLKAVHKHMREDLSMIWNQLPMAGSNNTH